MLFTRKLVAVFLLFFFVGKVYGRFENRILHGTIADPADFDWSIVEIIYTDFDGKPGLCTGTVISKRHILTAFYCIQNVQERIHPKFTFNIVSGTVRDYQLSFCFRNHVVDLAVIEFPPDVPFSKPVHKITLSGDFMDEAKYQSLINNSAIIAGYGIHGYYQGSKTGLHDGKLRVAKVPIWPSGWCNNMTEKICSSDYSPLGVGGDSGGPIFFHSLHIAHGIYIKAIQFGVLVQISGPSKYNYHVPLYRHCGWIAEVTNQEANCHISFPAEN